MQHKSAELISVLPLIILITVITGAFSSIIANYQYYYHIQSAFAAPLLSPSASTSNNIVNTKSVYEITFTTATTGTIKSVEIIFPAGSIMSGAQLTERSGIGPGVISISSTPSGPVVTYTITSPVSIAAGIPIRFELANIQNTNTAGNAAISITTKDTSGSIIDGPTNSIAYSIRQIGNGDIADNAITNNKIANGAITAAKLSQDNVYTIWTDRTLGTYDVMLRPSARLVYDLAIIDISNNAGNSRGPAIAVSGNNVYVAWADNTATSRNYEILFKKSTDGGSTFGINTINLSNNAGISTNPAIAVSGNNVYVMWQDFTVGNYEILFKKSTDGGSTFGINTINLSNNAVSSTGPAIAVSGNNVYVAWADNTASSGNSQILFRSSNDAGSTFGITISLSNIAGISSEPAIAVS